MMAINFRRSYLLDKLQDDIETGLRLALNRNFKHREGRPADDVCEDWVDNAHREVTGALFEALDLDTDGAE
jgi:hypothetical protein